MIEPMNVMEESNLEEDGGANDANDKPVFLEAEAKSYRGEVVKIPNVSRSPSVNSILIIQEDSPHQTCPGIYEKGACPPIQSYEL